MAYAFNDDKSKFLIYDEDVDERYQQYGGTGYIYVRQVGKVVCLYGRVDGGHRVLRYNDSEQIPLPLGFSNIRASSNRIGEYFEESEGNLGGYITFDPDDKSLIIEENTYGNKAYVFRCVYMTE